MNKSSLQFCLGIMIILIISCKKSDNSSNVLDTRTAITLKNVSFGTDTLQRMDIYLPANRSIDSTKILYLIHGGAWLAGDKSDYDTIITSLQKQLTQYAIVNINYRLASFSGTNEWPVQMSDINTAINYVTNNNNVYQINNSKSAILGESAGAQLSLLKGYMYNSNHNIKCVIDLFGPTDLIDLYNHPSVSTYPALLQLFMSGTPTSNYSNYLSASPLYSVNNQVPPTIIFHGTADTIVPIRQSDSLNKRLAIAGISKQYITYTGEGHGWTDSNWIDTYQKTIAFLTANNH